VLSAVALGEVGIIASREVSRWSRTDKDWCRLAEVCQIFGTLIGDEQPVYDVSYLDESRPVAAFMRTSMGFGREGLTSRTTNGKVR
jgi:DNA invertase Pin-like site-specific DNA recombinase